MPLKDYTTDKSPEETIGEITKLLQPFGIRGVLSEYDDTGNIVKMSFTIRIKDQDFAYRLPSDWRPVLKYFEQDRKTPRNLCTEDQARRTAWRQIYHWIDAQLALVQVNMVTMQEIFLPYWEDVRTGKTLYEVFDNNPGLLLGNGK